MKGKRRDNDAVAKPININKVKLVNKPWTNEQMEKERQLNKQKEIMLKAKKEKD